MVHKASAESSFTLPAVVGHGRFEILGPLGQGAGGVVYRAFDRERQCLVALKTLHAVTGEALLMLKNEFRHVQDLRHENLVQLYELFEEAGQWFFSMELVSGREIVAHVQQLESSAAQDEQVCEKPARRFDEPKLRAAFGQLAHGLCALHAAHKVHRDIKPSNVLVADSGRVVILDFGILGELEHGDDLSDGMIGTAAYMAPEQALGEPSGEATDWYAFGVMLYQALTGTLPFSGLDAEVIEKKLTQTPAPPAERGAAIPEDLNALCVSLLAEEPHLRPTGEQVLACLAFTADVQPAAFTTQTSVFVGRSTEMEALKRARRDVAEGANVTLLVRGESGVGKSFLIREFTDLVRQDPEARILRGRCYERESVPYKALDGIIDGLCVALAELEDEQVQPLIPHHANLLRYAFPVIDQVPLFAELPEPDRQGVSPKELRARVFLALRELLTRFAKRWPTVLVVDDLQWADNDSWVLLADLTRPPDAPPLLLLGTERMGTNARRLTADGHLSGARLEGDVRHVFLEPLPPEDAQELAVRLLGQAGTSDEVALAIAEEARGHPLFIDELIRHRGAGPRLTRTHLKLDDALWQRVERLDPMARRVLELLAVSGMPIEQQVAADAAVVSFGELQAALSALRAGNFVRSLGAHKHDTVETYHDRVRESVLTRMPAEERSGWHGRLALSLERTGRADPERLSTHYEGAGDFSRARDHALSAADKARDGLAFDHAVKLYRHALALCEPTPELAHDVGLRIAEALVNAGRSAEAAATYHKLAGTDASDASIGLRMRAAEEYLCSGHSDEGEAILREVLTSQRIGYPKSPGAAIASILYQRARLRVRGLEFCERSAESIDDAELQRVDLLSAAGNSLSMTDPLRSFAFHARSLNAALTAGEPTRVAEALCRYSLMTGSRGGPGKAQTLKQLAIIRRIASELPPSPFLRGLASAVEGFSHYFVGQWEQATAGLLEAESIFREQCLGATYQLAATRLVLCRNAVQRGDLADLRARTPAYQREADEKSDYYVAIGMRANVSYLLGLADDDLSAAERELKKAEEQLTPERFQLPHLYWQMARVNLSLYRGDARSALTRWQSLWRPAKRAMLFSLQVTQISALEQRARSHLAACVHDVAEPTSLRAVEADLEQLNKTEMPWAKAYATLLGAALSDLRNEPTAATRMQAAAELLEAGGMHLVAACARYQLGTMLGGDEGRTTLDRAKQWMQARHIVAPDRMAAMLVPLRAR